MPRRSPSLLWLGLLLGGLFWILESVLHTYVFDSGPLLETLLGEHDPNEVWMRILVTGLLAAFGGAADRLVRAERHDKERAVKLNLLFNYIHRFGQIIADSSRKNAPHATHPELTQIEAALLDEDEIGKIVQAMQGLSRFLDSRLEGLYAILQLTREINTGLLVNEVLDRIYETFRSVIPYNRIGVALLEDAGRTLTAQWARSDYGVTKLAVAHSAPMAGSSLERIIATGQPRIINDLAAYLAEHPNSDSSKMILEEGIRSSLTCPLIAVGKPIGFIFFSSREPGTYQNIHSEIFKLIAGQLSVVIEKSHMYEQLMREKELSESLLLNVMPARIIGQMKAGRQNPTEEIPDVGVLFADIVGFTDVASRYPADSIAQFLRDVFTTFDILSEKYGLEKIKTIGDAYMVSTGQPLPDNQGHLNLARFAMEVLSASANLHYPDGRPLAVRIGIHTGPVIAGVIGQKKFAYDIWGDTVNIAQRLESTGIPGHIHVSEAVYMALRDNFTFEPRGEIELKGQRRAATYFLREKCDT